MTHQHHDQTHRRRGRQRNPAKIIFVIFAVIGCVIFIFGCYWFWNDLNFRRNALTTTATITRIDVIYDSDDDADYTVYVAFTLAGHKYEGRLGYYTSGMRTGKEVQIYYNPDNPANFQGSGNIVGGILFALFGFIFMSIGLLPLILSRRKNGRNGYLLTNGRRIDAKITGVRRNTAISVNDRHPYRIHCQGFDHLGKFREFKSANLWQDPSYRLEQLDMKSLAVYIHETKPRKYYVDVRNL